MESYEVLDARIDRALLEWIERETGWASDTDCNDIDFERAAMCMASVRSLIDLTDEIKGFIVEMQLAEIRARRDEAAEEVKTLRTILGKDGEDMEEGSTQDAQTAGIGRQQEEG